MNEFDELKRKALDRFFGSLNEMQRKAVFKTQGPLLILAGAGSGKTTVLINRIANMIYFGDAYSYEDTRTHSDSDIQFLKDYIFGDSDDDARLSELVSHNRINPWNILAITFTNKAANELKERLANMLGQQGEAVAASTFHSSCARILRRECERLGYKPSFTIYDTDDSTRLIKEVLKDLDFSDKTFPPKTMLHIISAQKNAMVSPQQYYEMNREDPRESDIAEIYRAYNERMFAANAMDFDDLLVNTVKLFQECDDVLTHYQSLYKYILVDEYQDTNTVQFKLIDLLAARHCNLCVVGDDDQSIYKFRGATIENILSFEDAFGCDKETDVIKLEQNYRSTQNILSSANALVSNNKNRLGKTLRTDLGYGGKVTLFTAINERTEAKYIANVIKEAVKNGGTYSEHAVLYRMNAQSNAIEQAFVREDIPYIVYGGLKFYERKEIRDILAYLSVINNPDDSLRMRRIINEPKRGIGDATVTAIEHIASDLKLNMLDVMRESDKYAPIVKKSKILTGLAQVFDKLTEDSEKMPTSKLLDELIELTGYKEMLMNHGEDGKMRLDNIAELKSTMVNYENENPDASLSGFLEEVSLFTDIDKYDENADYVSLMTIHSAKGLEFNTVFVPGVEENIFPSARSLESEEDIEEERRLAYVAITRAKRKLYLLHSRTRMIFGKTGASRPSRFLEELPAENTKTIEEESPFEKSPIQKPKRPDYSHECSDMLRLRKSSMEINKGDNVYTPGDVVIHPNPKFGKGVVISCEPIGKETLIEVAFDSCGTKKFFASTARLRKES